MSTEEHSISRLDGIDKRIDGIVDAVAKVIERLKSLEATREHLKEGQDEIVGGCASLTMRVDELEKKAEVTGMATMPDLEQVKQLVFDNVGEVIKRIEILEAESEATVNHGKRLDEDQLELQQVHEILKNTVGRIDKLERDSPWMNRLKQRIESLEAYRDADVADTNAQDTEAHELKVRVVKLEEGSSYESPGWMRRREVIKKLEQSVTELQGRSEDAQDTRAGLLKRIFNLEQRKIPELKLPEFVPPDLSFITGEFERQGKRVNALQVRMQLAEEWQYKNTPVGPKRSPLAMAVESTKGVEPDAVGFDLVGEGSPPPASWTRKPLEETVPLAGLDGGAWRDDVIEILKRAVDILKAVRK